MSSPSAALAVCALLGALVAAPAARADADAFFDTSLGDLRAELDTARQQGKQAVLLMFEMEGCPYCRRMRQTVLNRADVQTYFHRHFLIFSVDTHGSLTLNDFAGRELSERRLAESMQVRGTPTFVFVDLDGREMSRYVGATRDAAEFMRLGRAAAGRVKVETDANKEGSSDK